MPPVVSRRVAVPPGWRREIKEGRVHYFSPDCRCMVSAEDVLRHLLSAETCKCGLPCPFHVDSVFNFDPHLESSHKDNSFALRDAPLLAPGSKHSCRVVSRADDKASGHPHTDTKRNQPWGPDGAIDAEMFPLFRPANIAATSLPLSTLSSRVEAVSTPRSELNPSEQSNFPNVYARRDSWHGLQGDLMQQAPPIVQHTSQIMQQIPSHSQQWETPTHVAAPRLPPALYETTNPAPPTHPRQHHQYGMAYNSPMLPGTYPTDLHPLPLEAPFGSQFCGDSQPSPCLSFSPLSTHSTSSMALPQHSSSTQSRQGYPSSVYPPPDPWAAQNQDPSPKTWPHMPAPLKEAVKECGTMFRGEPAQSVLDPLYAREQQGTTPQLAPIATTRVQHGVPAPLPPPEDVSCLSVKVEDPSPEAAMEAAKEPVVPKSEVVLGNNAQFQPLHDSSHETLSSKPEASRQLSFPLHTHLSLSSCSSSSSSDSSSSASSSDDEETARGTRNGSHEAVCPPLVVSYRREEVDCWLKKEEESHELLSMAVRIPLSALPGSAKFKPASPGHPTSSPPEPHPLPPESHPHENMPFESGGDLSDELWVKIELGMTQKQPDTLCDVPIGGIEEFHETGANMQLLPSTFHVPPSKGKRLARRGSTKERDSASPDGSFSPFDLARMDRTLLGLRPRGKPAGSQQPLDKGDTATVELSRKTRQMLRESPTRESSLPPCKKRISEDFQAYLPKGVDIGELSHMSFTDGTLVWAKGKSLPFWPGMICAAKELAQKPPAPGKHWVRWFGDSTFSETEESNMKPLADGMAHYVNALERKKGIKDRQRLIVAFKEAFKAITNESKEEEFIVEEESIHSGEEAPWH